MPKLPLDPDRLRQLPGLAVTALRHPRRTASHVVSGTVTVVGGLLDRRAASEPLPGTTTSTPAPPPTDVATEPPEAAAVPTSTAPTPAAPTEEQGAPDAEQQGAPDAEQPTVSGPEGPVSPAGAGETAESTAATSEDETEEQLSGPVPHIPPGIAREVERDYGEDLPGVSGERER